VQVEHWLLPTLHQTLVDLVACNLEHLNLVDQAQHLSLLLEFRVVHTALRKRLLVQNIIGGNRAITFHLASSSRLKCILRRLAAEHGSHFAFTRHRNQISDKG
jgi:hypothetical protein